MPAASFLGADIGLPDAEALYRHPAGYYRRETLLPRHRRNYDLIQILFGGVEKPVFTTASTHNHLIALAEMLAMYLLVSPAPIFGVKVIEAIQRVFT